MSKSKEVYGYVKIDYNSGWILPLEEAHKVQAILARHGIKLEEAWLKGQHPNVKFIRDLEVPEVSVVSLPEMDARGLSNKQIGKWHESFRDAMDENLVIMKPQDFIAVTGED